MIIEIKDHHIAVLFWFVYFILMIEIARRHKGPPKQMTTTIRTIFMCIGNLCQSTLNNILSFFLNRNVLEITIRFLLNSGFKAFEYTIRRILYLKISVQKICSFSSLEQCRTSSQLSPRAVDGGALDIGNLIPFYI